MIFIKCYGSYITIGCDWTANVPNFSPFLFPNASFDSNKSSLLKTGFHGASYMNLLRLCRTGYVNLIAWNRRVLIKSFFHNIREGRLNELLLNGGVILSRLCLLYMEQNVWLNLRQPKMPYPACISWHCHYHPPPALLKLSFQIYSNYLIYWTHT